MELFTNISIGLETVLTVQHLLFCFIGALLGTLIGILPGLGPTATIAMLLPMTFMLSPTASLIMLAGVYYGAQYGGSATAILINVPGESGSIVTAIDGYQMARQGRAGPALAVAALGSFVAGSLATLVIALFSPLLARVALNFGAAEYFSLMVLGLIASVVLASGSLIKALAMIVLGLLLGLIGTDVTTGFPRYTFGFLELFDGISFVAVAMGMFGINEVVRNLENETRHSAVVHKITSLMPTKADFAATWKPVLRGSALGSLLGILPGGGALISSFVAYSVEKKLASDPSRFGRGAIEGVAGPESANNAGAQTSFIPMLTLGLPSNPVMALMIGAMVIQGIRPGPDVMNTDPSLFWGLIVSMWVGNAMLLVLNLPLVGIWVRLLTVPYHLLYPAILVFCTIGAFSLNNSTFDVFVLAGFALVGYVLTKLGCEPAPLLLGFILGPMMEEYLRRALLLSHGNPMVLIERPGSATMLILSLLLIASILIPAWKKTREEALEED